MKKIKIAIVGYGNRGQVYADYSLDEPEEVEIVAIIDPNEYKLETAKNRYGLNGNQIFTSYKDFLAKNIQADIVVNATMDSAHYQTAIEILQSKHDMLIEKPIVADREELLSIKRTAEENGCKVFVCHVLRYTPFYQAIKNVIHEGKIGEVMSMEMNEHVWIPHYLTSYGRGKWSDEDECGSPFLLAKCCHDSDLICWLNEGGKPASVVSFASRSQFVEANKPKDAADRCVDCIYKDTCMYSAIDLYYTYDTMPFLVLDHFNKPYEEITKEEKWENLKHGEYGECAYKTKNLVDRQNMIVNFDNGSICAFTMVGGACKPARYIHIVGSKGEIEGKLENNKFTLRSYDHTKLAYLEEEIDLSNSIINNALYGGHSGGDYGIMHDLVRHYNGECDSMSITYLNDSVAGHMLVYGAEESRKTGKIVKL